VGLNGQGGIDDEPERIKATRHMQASDAVSPPTSAADRPPRAAATIVVVRDGGDGIEVLLSRRAERGDHNSGAWVFPGGIVDPGDRQSHDCCAGVDDIEASARLGLPSNGLDYYVAAVRECFEESGLLFATGADGELVRLDDAAGTALGAWRGPLHRNERSLGQMCRAFGLKLALDRLVYLSHWLTPLARPKRFDTRFFVAAAPMSQTAAFDGTEMVEQLWLRPAAALARATELKLMTPTQKTLELVGRYETVEALLAWARAPRDVALIMPRVGKGSEGMRPVLPEEPAFAELGRIDPAGHGFACYEIQVATPVRLSPRLIRVTANNGSMMTGPGTNTYLLGGGPTNEWAVIDPGPLDGAHVEAILAAAPGPIRWIFATHTHCDHSPATIPLKSHTGAIVHGRVPNHKEWQDASFSPDVHLKGGERFDLPGPDGQRSTLLAIHTPGHASNHICYLLEEEKLLFTGDHVMQASTVVINPPDGDMAAYIASLRELTELELHWLAPGHGFLMENPKHAMQSIVAHRLKREAKVLEAMRALGPADADALLARVYDDVNPKLLAMAMRSLRAHLFKLRDEGVAIERDGLWALIGS
jgi:glyoxylase-like metal-dependent hydrolase (beta-lactamase superfamily II)/8-oxo-dGTP pyrophosphatase MutT (NUDIX family)